MKRSHEEMAAGSGAASGAAAPPPPGRPRVVSRQEFKLVPAPDAARNAVQQAVLALVFAGEDVNTDRCECRYDRRPRGRGSAWAAFARPVTATSHSLSTLLSPPPLPAASDLGERPELPGPLAVTLSRRTLKLVEAGEYMVCEKSDGERAMLLAVGSPWRGVPPGTYLVNRSFGVMTFAQGREYAALLNPPPGPPPPGGVAGGSAGPTLLDGELILRPDDAGSGTGARAVYMVFDAIALNGAPVGREGFDRRMRVIGEAVRAPFRAADERALAGGQPGLPLYLLGKFFMPKSRVAAIFEAITEAGHAGGGGSSPTPLTAPLESEMGGDGSAASAGGAPPAQQQQHRVYRHDIRVNGTDGIVFTPVRASYTDMFKSGSAACACPLLKWKFADENTVDFRVTRHDLENAIYGGGSGAGGGSSSSSSAAAAAPTGTPHTLPVQLWLSGGRDRRSGLDIDLTVARTYLTLPSAEAYLKLMGRLRVDSLVVEAAYDAGTSGWAIRRVRDRKTRANHVATGWQTLEVVAEGITPAELVARLQPPPPQQQQPQGQPQAPAAAGGR
jgi:hypothetical protein